MMFENLTIKDNLKRKIYNIIKDYYLTCHKFKPSKVLYGGRVFDEKEIQRATEACLEFYLTENKFCNEFSNSFKEKLGVKHCNLVNSGSSANLIAISALMQSELESKAIKAGDEIITTACCFPTTLSPIINNGLIPVFVDITLPDYNIDCSKLKKALSTKTKAVFIAHTLGNPFDLTKVKKFCNENNLWLIEDCCDGFLSKYKNKNVGTFGDIATFSFYPAHGMTTGEGGAVVTNSNRLNNIISSLISWGKSCTCSTGQDNVCNNRFTQKNSLLPVGYDHKYTYKYFGYNLKMTEIQGAIGIEQLKKIDYLNQARTDNFNYFYENLKEFEHSFILPEATRESEPIWFGFLLTVKKDALFTRNEIVQYLEDNNIQTRPLFAGNIINQPCFDYLRDDMTKYRVVDKLDNTDLVMNNTFWFGVYAGITDEKRKKVIKDFKKFIENKIVK
jgi:CDP-6-deoxy-D-xylo-4-hexulose-3-dehydrase